MKEKSGFWLLNPASKIESILLALLLLFLPTQFGKHFWPSFANVSGIRVDYLSPTIYATDIILFLLFLLVLFRMGFIYTFSLMQKHGGMFFITSVFFVIASIGMVPLLGVYLWVRLCMLLFLGLYCARYINTINQLVFIGVLFAVASYFESLLGILQFISQSSLNGWLYYLGERTFTGNTPGIANVAIDGNLLLRPYGTFSHPNVLGGYLLISSLLVLFFSFRNTHRSMHTVMLFFLVIMSIAILLTLSRVVIIAWFVIVCSWLLSVVFKKKPYRKSIVYTLLFGIALGVFVVPFLKLAVLRFTETSFVEDAVTQRTQLLLDAITLIKQYPFFGVGMGGFIPAIAQLHSLPYILLQPVHNIFLLIAAETGLVGFSIFTGFILLTVVRLITKIFVQQLFVKEHAVFLLLLLCIVFIGLFDHYFVTLQQGQLLFAFILGLCWTELREK